MVRLVVPVKSMAFSCCVMLKRMVRVLTAWEKALAEGGKSSRRDVNSTPDLHQHRSRDWDTIYAGDWSTPAKQSTSVKLPLFMGDVLNCTREIGRYASLQMDCEKIRNICRWRHFDTAGDIFDFLSNQISLGLHVAGVLLNFLSDQISPETFAISSLAAVFLQILTDTATNIIKKYNPGLWAVSAAHNFLQLDIV